MPGQCPFHRVKLKPSQRVYPDEKSHPYQMSHCRRQRPALLKSSLREGCQSLFSRRFLSSQYTQGNRVQLAKAILYSFLLLCRDDAQSSCSGSDSTKKPELGKLVGHEAEAFWIACKEQSCGVRFGASKTQM